MADAWKTIRLTEFEHVVTGPSESLLRVSAKLRRRAHPARPSLVVDRIGSEQSFRPLAAPPDPPGVIRAAYAVPTDLIADPATLWLEFSDASRLRLPEPSQGAARMRDAGPAATPEPVDVPGLAALSQSVPTTDPGELGAQWDEAAEPVASAPESEDAEPVTAGDPDASAAAEALESELRSLRQQVAELERARDDDARAAAAAAAQAEARADAAEQRAESERAAAQAAAQTADRADSERLRALGDLQTAHERIAMLERELSQQVPIREGLMRELEDIRAVKRHLERELDEARDHVRVMTLERDELSRQAAAFDGVAVKARERAAAAEAEGAKTSAALRELEVWRGELERRLADTTSELGAMRAARDADERELARLRAAVQQSPGSQAPANGSEPDPDLVAEQAVEIQRLAAELAALRSQLAQHD